MRHIKTIAVVAVALVTMGQGCLTVGGGNDAPETSGPAGMFISTDKTETWQQISALPTVEGVQTLNAVSVYRLYEDPQDPQAMYWTSRQNGLFYTYDDGKSWQQPGGPLSSGFVYGLTIHPQDKCTIYAATSRAVYKTVDCSRNWEEVYRESRGGVSVRAISFNPFPPHQLYAGLSNGDVLRSIDLGGSWQVATRVSGSPRDIVANPLQDGTIYITTNSAGLYRSDDAGRTWLRLSEGLEEFSDALEFRRFALHPNNPNTLYWISTYGILVSNDRGESWKALDLITPPGSADIYAFAINPRNDNEMYYTATINNRSTMYRTIDGGASWMTQRLPTGQIPTALRVHPEEENWVYAGFTIPPSN